VKCGIKQASGGGAVTADVSSARKQLLEELGHRLCDQAAKYERTRREKRQTSSSSSGEFFVCLFTLCLQ